MKYIKLKTGDIRGLLTVTGEIRRDKRNYILYICKCECGNEIAVHSGKLNSGHTKSCGCLAKKITSETFTTHGHTKNRIITPEYKSYNNMKQRCLNSKNTMFKHYGGRGITICERWLESFESFMEDMGKIPVRGFQIERIDNNGNYEPSNCKWASTFDQGRNKRNNLVIIYKNEKYVLTDLCKSINISRSAFKRQMKRFGVDGAMDFYKNKTISLITSSGGESHLLTEWARIFKVHRMTLKEHLEKKSIDMMIDFYQKKNLKTKIN